MSSNEIAAGSRKGAGLLFFLGFALLATGVGFAFAPQFSWKVTQIARKANELGLQNGVLAVGGLVLFGLGIVARMAAGSRGSDSGAAGDELRSEMNLLNEQVSNRLGQLRAALQQINEGIVGVAAQQQVHMQAQSQAPSPGGDQSQNAVFRLAASLDKLHAQLDERVHALDLQLRKGFETLLNMNHEVRRFLDNRPPAPLPSPAEFPQPGQFVPPVHGQAEPEAGIDFYETMQKLDAIAGEEAPQSRGGRQPQPQPPFPSQGGGQPLDALLPEEYRDRY